MYLGFNITINIFNTIFADDDAEKFLSKTAKQVSTDQLEETSIGADEDIITKDDTRQNKQFYDAFILFADADIEFATKIMERMEERKLKVTSDIIKNF